MKKAFSLLLPLGMLLITACGFSNPNSKSMEVDPKDTINDSTATLDSTTVEFKNAEAELKSFLEKN